MATKTINKKTAKTSKQENSATSSSRKKQPTAAELREWYAKEQARIERFERSEKALQLLDPSKSNTKSFSVFSKETLRTYMKNPLTNYKNLRNLSRFLYYRSQIYKRIISYNATMIDTNYRTIIPYIDITKGVDTTKMIKSFYDTSVVLEKFNLNTEMLKAYTKCWIEDVFFGVLYFDENEGGFILPLDPDYCQITSIYPTGDYGFDMDMSYFRSHKTELELWGEPFTSMYKAYEADSTSGRWQQVPDEYCVCFKIDSTDLTIPIPPYINLFDSIINLEDLKEITNIADEANIYKLLVAKIPTISGTNEVNDFAVDPDLAIDYFNRMKQDLPDYVDAIISPIDVDSINFDKDQASDVNKVENASKNILKTSGHSILAEASGTTATKAAIVSDVEYAISSLIGQTQAWVNRMLAIHVSNPSKVKFLEVTKYTKVDYKDSVIKDMNYGVPLVMTLGALNGYSELDMLSMANLNSALGLDELFKPLSTASTRSSEDSIGGRPQNENPTDESEDSEQKREDNG